MLILNHGAKHAVQITVTLECPRTLRVTQSGKFALKHAPLTFNSHCVQERELVVHHCFRVIRPRVVDSERAQF